MPRGLRVMVAGSTGLLGPRLVAHLAGLGHEVIGLARGRDADVQTDLTDATAASSAIRSGRPQAFVHLVSATNVDQCERDPDFAYRLNVRTVENVVDGLEAMSDACHLVYVSTDHLYDAPGDNAEDQLCLRNVYALTKRCAERVASEVGATVLRTNFFGRSHTEGRSSFTDWIREQGAAGRPMTLFTDVEFSPLSIETLCLQIGRVLARPRPGVYNVGSREGMSKSEFARRVAGRLGLSLTGATDGTQADVTLGARRPTGMKMSSRRFEADFEVRMPTLAEEIGSAEL
jgi:dTDP-4-dehydrorhamnose reductase